MRAGRRPTLARVLYCGVWSFILPFSTFSSNTGLSCFVKIEGFLTTSFDLNQTRWKGTEVVAAGSPEIPGLRDGQSLSTFRKKSKISDSLGKTKAA